MSGNHVARPGSLDKTQRVPCAVGCGFGSPAFSRIVTVGALAPSMFTCPRA